VIFHLFNIIFFKVQPYLYWQAGGLPFEYIGWFQKFVNGQFIVRGAFLFKNRKKIKAKNM